jgi:hypothetical protein
MIAITAEFKGCKYLVAYGFTNFPKAEKEAREFARQHPNAGVYIADRQAHVNGCLTLVEFQEAYFSA